MFDFGANWQKYSKEILDEEKIKEAEKSLKKLLKFKDLKNKTFLDLGCGSGIFALAAKNLRAKKVIGVDINPKCIFLSRKNCPAGNFFAFSVLNEKKMAQLGLFDIVYAWGSLHHTGDMERAIKLASLRVKKNGVFVLAIYNKHWSSPFWKIIKFVYNSLPSFARQILNYLFLPTIFLAKFLVTGKNPLAKERGMNFFIDIIDWLGGYPYEYAGAKEIEKKVSAFGFKLTKFIPPVVPTGCNEFVFRKITN